MSTSAISISLGSETIPDAVVGDHVLVHAGFAIQKIDEEFAAESLEMLRSMGIKTAEDIEAELAEAEGSGASEAPAS